MNLASSSSSGGDSTDGLASVQIPLPDASSDITVSTPGTGSRLSPAAVVVTARTPTVRFAPGS